MEQMINIEDIISSVIAGYILFLITKNHSKCHKSGLTIRIKFKTIDLKFYSNKKH